MNLNGNSVLMRKGFVVAVLIITLALAGMTNGQTANSDEKDIVIVSPAIGENYWDVGDTDEIIVTGSLVYISNNTGVEDEILTIDIGYGMPMNVNTGENGAFSCNMLAPEEPGNYTVTISGENNVTTNHTWYVIDIPHGDPGPICYVIAIIPILFVLSLIYTIYRLVKWKKNKKA